MRPHDQRRRRWHYLLAIGLVTLLPIVSLTVCRFARPPEAVRLEGEAWVADPGAYAGSEACRECHADIVRAQLASNHAQTCRDLARRAPRAPFGADQAVVDPLTGARYTMEKAAGGYEIAVSRGHLRASQRLDFEFGSGAHAHGYLTKLDDGSWMDARLNYYREIQGWDFTSGQEKPHAYLRTQPLGRPLKGSQGARCFSCHGTVVRAHDLDKPPFDGSQLRLRPELSILGVTCESCHGPRAGHVRDRQQGRPIQARTPLTAQEMNQLCGRCHGISNVNPAHPVIARFQPWGLSESRCFRNSGGQLSCVTCHSPHQNVRKDALFYEGKCLSCHGGSGTSVGRSVCPVNPRTGCVSCHMPHDSKSMLHVTFTDHRIRIVPHLRRPPRGLR